MAINVFLTVSKLNKLKQKLDDACDSLVLEIQPKVEFDDFAIFHQASDGFVVEWNMKNAPLGTCLRIINENGFLSIDDFIKNCI